MSSRRGRLNWSNLEVHISDEAINKQHRFPATQSFSPDSISTETIIDKEEEETKSTASAKPIWVPRTEVGEIQIEHFVGNFMLTNAEQTAIDKKYIKPLNKKEPSTTIAVSKPIRISNRLSTNSNTLISVRTNNLTVGQHLFNVFVCHVESLSCVYIMFGDDYNRATRLFEEMNSCDELLRPATSVHQPMEKDFVALYHEKKWFRGQCLTTTDIGVNVLCIDSGAIINCSRHDLRRLPDRFRTCPPCCIECFLSGIPPSISMNSIPDSISSECCELLYKDRYEAVVTKIESGNRPTIVLYYANENVNDRLLKTLQLI